MPNSFAPYIITNFVGLYNFCMLKMANKRIFLKWAQVMLESKRD